MDKDGLSQSFTPRHHALLFAWISKEILLRAGIEKGEPAIRKAVKRYGEQRGHRMALRARANGHPLDMPSYLTYGEWRALADEMEGRRSAEGLDLRSVVYRCPWQTVWAETDLVEYGRFYCLEIDQALVRGFNPTLRLDVNQTQSNDGQPCDFLFYDGMSRMATSPTSPAVMGWDYHTGHLFKTMSSVLKEELGKTGEESVRTGLDEFARKFGVDAARAITSYLDVDFDQLPGY
jgi:hypothetical protein